MDGEPAIIDKPEPKDSIDSLIRPLRADRDFGFSEDTRSKAVWAYVAGVPMDLILAAVGCNYWTVKRWVRREGITVGKRPRKDFGFARPSRLQKGVPISSNAQMAL